MRPLAQRKMQSVTSSSQELRQCLRRRRLARDPIRVGEGMICLAGSARTMETSSRRRWRNRQETSAPHYEHGEHRARRKDGASHLLAQRSEAGSHLFREELRLLPGGEVTTPVEPVVIDQVAGIGALCPALGRLIQLMGEDADGE